MATFYFCSSRPWIFHVTIHFWERPFLLNACTILPCVDGSLMLLCHRQSRLLPVVDYEKNCHMDVIHTRENLRQGPLLGSNGVHIPKLWWFQPNYTHYGLQRGSDDKESAWRPRRETKVQSLGLENPLEKGKATHSSILLCRIPWIKKPGGL